MWKDTELKCCSSENKDRVHVFFVAAVVIALHGSRLMLLPNFSYKSFFNESNSPWRAICISNREGRRGGKVGCAQDRVRKKIVT